MKLKDAAIEVVGKLRANGCQAYLVGGCVRDLLLGREPADYDVATDATPDQVMQIFPRTYAVGAQFGVVLVPVTSGNPAADSLTRPGNTPGNLPQSPSDYDRDEIDSASRAGMIEVATFRSDGLYSDGRRPDTVEFSKSPQDDVRRRDFTINGLLLDPVSNEVLDYVGGRFDLNAGIVRTIGDAELRFSEDRLRMLRAIRFAARLKYQIDVEAMSAIQRHASAIHSVSRERIRDELSKMLTEGHARPAFEMLDVSGLLREILPEVAAMKGVAQPSQFHPEGDVWMHTLLMLDALPAGVPLTLAFGALLHDVGKPPTFRMAPDRIRFDQHAEVGTRMAEEICKRLRLSKDDTAQICSLVANHMRFGNVREMRDSTFKRFARLPGFEQHLELHRLDCNASHKDLDLYDFAQHKLASLPPEAIRPKPLLTGDDLLAAGYRAGPRFKEILAAVEDAQMEGAVCDKQEALALLKEKFPR